MSGAPDSPPLRHAATVMLVREAGHEVEVLVTRRHDKLAFMGGMWVFPGGTLSAADASPEAISRIPEIARSRCARFADLAGATLEDRLCFALIVAAHRETLEETGVVLATTSDGERCSGTLLTRIQNERRAIAADAARFPALLQELGLMLDASKLTYWAHWITPSNGTRRFDTRFFAVAVPPAETASIDATEAVDHLWERPAALLEAAGDGRMRMPPPTRYNLMALDAGIKAHGSLAAALAAHREQPIPPVLPRMMPSVTEGERPVAVMPWDAEYASLGGEGVPAGREYPPWLRELPSRSPF